MAALAAILSVSCIGLIADSDDSDAAGSTTIAAAYVKPTDGSVGTIFSGGMNPGDPLTLWTLTTYFPAWTFEGYFDSKVGGTRLGGWGDVIYIPDMHIFELWGRWIPKQFELSFNPGTGSGTMAPQMFTASPNTYATFTVPQPTFTPQPGYAFVNWKVQGTSTTYSPGNTFTSTSNVTLIAQWELNLSLEFIISYNANGADGITNSQLIQNGNIAYLSNHTFTVPSSINFLGWRINNAGPLYAPGDPFKPVSDTEFFAQWGLDPGGTTNQFIITYTSSQGTIPAQIVEEGNPFTVKGISHISGPPEGKTLMGWQVQGTTLVLQPGTTFTPTADMTLVAKWSSGSGSIDINNLMMILLIIIVVILLAALAYTRFGFAGAIVVLVVGGLIIGIIFFI